MSTLIHQGTNPGTSLAVEAAWGADLAADPATWTWSDITADVRGRQRVAIRIGRGDEAGAAQPATCKVTLDNTSGAYSQGGQAANWPYVRRNTPIRVRVQLPDTTWVTRFFGGATSWKPEWDSTGRNAVVKLEAAGTRRRLSQGVTPILSSLRRVMLDSSTLVAYWPCEDPLGATSIAPGLTTHGPMTLSGQAEQPYPKWAADADTFACSAPLPEVNGTVWRGAVPATSATAGQVRWLMKAPTLITGTEQIILSIYTTGTVSRWDLAYVPVDDGSLKLYTTEASTGTRTQRTYTDFNVDDTARRYSVSFSQSGGNIAWSVAVLGVGFSLGGSTSGTFAGTSGRVTAVAVNPDGLITDTVIGHITVQDTVSSIYDESFELNASAGEFAVDRLERVCAENSIPITVTGTANRPMGPQLVAPLLSLLDEVQEVDRGLLYDGLDNGFTYTTYDTARSRPADLTLDAAGGDLGSEVVPVDDDQRTRNKVTAKQARGSEYTEQDTDGPAGTDAIGVYDSTVTVNTYYGEGARDVAGWLINLGTVVGYRHPSLVLDLAKNPELMAAWCDLRPGNRIDVTGLDTIRTQHPAGTVSLLLEGWTETIDQHRWDVEAVCSPYQPYRVALAADTTGDTDEHVARACATGSTLAASASAGATSLSVATPAGEPLWTTTADDYPLYLDVGGIRVTATACSGASSPQTITVTGSTVTKALTSGLTVDVWQPPVIGL